MYKQDLIQLLKRWCSHHKLPEKLWVAYSGGRDSHVLLHSLKKIVLPQLMIEAVHVNHQLHPKANEWATHCHDVCSSLGINLYTEVVTINDSGKDSVEMAARQARRAVWQKIMTKDAAILLAHHQQDQAETLLYRLVRGTGIEGMQAMRETDTCGNGLLMRPLLHVCPQLIQAYANEHQLEWIEDSSNDDVQHDRNYIRHEVLPLVKKRWPDASKQLARASQHCQTAVTQYQPIIEQFLSQAQGTQPNSLSITALRKFEQNKRRAVIRAWLQTHDQQMPSEVQLGSIEQCLVYAKQDAMPLYETKHYQLRSFDNELVFIPRSNTCKSNDTVTKVPMSWDWQQHPMIYLDNGHYLALIPVTELIESPELTIETTTENSNKIYIYNDKLNYTEKTPITNQATKRLTKRNRDLVLIHCQCLKQEKDLESWQALLQLTIEKKTGFLLTHHLIKDKVLSIRFNNWGKTAKKRFQEAKIPPWERTKYPVVFAEDKLLAISNLWART